MPKPIPPPPTLGELLAEPVGLNKHQVCQALCEERSQADERLANGTFPVKPMEPRKRGVPLRFALADVLAVLGFDLGDILRELAGVLRDLGPSLSSSPAGDHGERAA